MHDVIIVTVPLLAILAGLFFNRSDVQALRVDIRGLDSRINDLRSEMRSELGSLRSEMRSELDGLRTEMRSEFGKVHADLRMFYGITGELKGRVDEIAKR